MKPDIVFFGEPLPSRFFELRELDLASADLLIVCGTSLSVAPFCHLNDLCNPLAPRLLINLQRVGMPNWMSNGNGFRFDQPDNYRDVELLVPCDDGVRIFCDLLGWRDELEAIVAQSASGSNTSLSNTSRLAGNYIDAISRNQRAPEPPPPPPPGLDVMRENEESSDSNAEKPSQEQYMYM